MKLHDPSETIEYAREAAEAVATFEQHPERRALRDRDQRLRGESDGIERELTGVPGAVSDDDPAEALADGREPAAHAGVALNRHREALYERRRVLHRALEALARKRLDLDARITRELLAPLAEPYGRLIAEQAKRVREIAAVNDVLASASELFERTGMIGSSAVLYPMHVVAIGQWSDDTSRARWYWREAVEHGHVANAE